MGLFIGASILTVVELLDFAYENIKEEIVNIWKKLIAPWITARETGKNDDKDEGQNLQESSENTDSEKISPEK